VGACVRVSGWVSADAAGGARSQQAAAAAATAWRRRRTGVAAAQRSAPLAPLSGAWPPPRAPGGHSAAAGGTPARVRCLAGSLRPVCMCGWDGKEVCVCETAVLLVVVRERNASKQRARASKASIRGRLAAHLLLIALCGLGIF